MVKNKDLSDKDLTHRIPKSLALTSASWVVSLQHLHIRFITKGRKKIFSLLENFLCANFEPRFLYLFTVQEFIGNATKFVKIHKKILEVTK